MDPTTFEILSAWYPPQKNETLGFPYMEYLAETNDVLVSSAEGNVYVVHRDSCKGKPYFTTQRTIKLASVMQPGEKLLNTMFDASGNIWFTTGSILTGDGSGIPNSTTFGYITPNNVIHKSRVPDEMVENGIAVSGTNVWMNTSPTGKKNKPGAPGYMYALTAKCGGGIDIRWRVPYDAGSKTEIDPAKVTSRGSGTTPALLADKYVVIVDRADSQVHVNVYHQNPQGPSEKQLLCRLPLFSPGKSEVLNSVLAHYDGKKYGIMIQNSFNGPPIYTGQQGQTLNGEYNDMSTMAGGIDFVDIDADGQCSLRWSSDLAVKAVSVLSTKTGLIYSYVEDTKRSPKGEYVWYVAGIDWYTGKTVFQIRTGTGGAFNDNWAGGSLGPDGTFYQAVTGGVVAVKDERAGSYKGN